MEKRKLVSLNESARHPLRRMLPPPTGGLLVVQPEPSSWWKKEDTHLFLLSFTAFFITFYSFIA
ncbi:hypothetical protein ACFOWX_09735 [Sphingorhabdus arenilitoris]|uniref:Uncharacterized protein n=1 Tax=Sphingorhabdus arenilitoris TaxID=1490041 RepID=A0ABV8RH66_9SPHN